MKIISKSILYILVLFSLIITGCGGTKEPVEEITNEAVIEGVDIEMRGEIPKQVIANVVGTLPDSCTKINQLSPVKEDSKITVKVSTIRTSGIKCDKNPFPFSESVTLPVFNLPAGVYQVVTQGTNEITGSFEFLKDNTIQSESISSDAIIEKIDIELIDAQPAKVIVTIIGTLKDPCTSLEDIEEVFENNTFKINLITAREAHTMCNSQARVPFEKDIELDISELDPGTYKIDAQGVIETFEIK